MDIEITLTIDKVSGGFMVCASSAVADAGGSLTGVATTPHGATVQARKLVKELLEKIEHLIGKEGA